MRSYTITRPFADTEIPTGPEERDIEYQATFTLQNRKPDYATAGAKLEERKS
jgi:hypothetical protein